jgi:hypothetical protein
VIPGGAWQHPAAEGENGHSAAFLGRPGRRPGLLLLRAKKIWEKAIISQWRRFDLLLAAMPEKILDQVMDMVDSMSEDFPYDMLYIGPSSGAHTLPDHEKLDVFYKSEPLVDGSHPRCGPLCRPTVPLAWNRPSSSSAWSCSVCLLPCGLCLGNRSGVTLGAWWPG